MATASGAVVANLGHAQRLLRQGIQITNQTVIYALQPEAGSRTNSTYMFCDFFGGAVSSLSAGAVFALGGRDAVCMLGPGY